MQIKPFEKIELTIMVDKIKKMGARDRFAPIPSGIYTLTFHLALMPIKSKYKASSFDSNQEIKVMVR